MSDEKLRVNDLVVLGNACPDIISDQRITVCTVGFSATYGLIRIYPVPPISHMKRWNCVELPLERNTQDTRPESWKIEGSKSEWDKLASKINLKGKLSKDEQVTLLDELHRKFGQDCVEALNDKKMSLGMIKPRILGYEFEKRDDYEPSIQTHLGRSTPFLTIKNYPYRPMIQYRCPDCRTVNPHRQQLVEWGVFEWMRNNPEATDKVWENLRLGEPGYERSFLVGNMALHRNSFMIVSIFRSKTDSD
jgi:hypothetical protein